MKYIEIKEENKTEMKDANKILIKYTEQYRKKAIWQNRKISFRGKLQLISKWERESERGKYKRANIPTKNLCILVSAILIEQKGMTFY